MLLEEAVQALHLPELEADLRNVLQGHDADQSHDLSTEELGSLLQASADIWSMKQNLICFDINLRSMTFQNWMVLNNTC